MRGVSSPQRRSIRPKAGIRERSWRTRSRRRRVERVVGEGEYGSELLLEEEVVGGGSAVWERSRRFVKMAFMPAL